MKPVAEPVCGSISPEGWRRGAEKEPLARPPRSNRVHFRTWPRNRGVDRKIERHVSFGFGIHLCVGAALARLKSRIAFAEFLQRYPNYELRTPVRRAYSSNVRGLASLPIALQPTA
jgi:cytochrome P450